MLADDAQTAAVIEQWTALQKQVQELSEKMTALKGSLKPISIAQPNHE
jgi:hypothetical protein